MKKTCIILIAIAAMSACTPVRAVGNAAVTTGQVALGAVDVVL